MILPTQLIIIGFGPSESLSLMLRLNLFGISVSNIPTLTAITGHQITGKYFKELLCIVDIKQTGILGKIVVFISPF